jgi:exodeoxyribonuclease VII small subunit
MNEAKFEFEKALKELEAITLWFESTDVDLDQGLVKFERGMELRRKPRRQDQAALHGRSYRRDRGAV